MSDTNLSVIILAAGQGTRMRSAMPKVLQPLGGRPMLAHVLDTARDLGPRHIHVVYGHGGDAVPAAFDDATLDWVLQAEQLGTGHAVQQAMPNVPDSDIVLVLYGDVPLIRPATLELLTVAAAEGALAVLTAHPEDPTGYGRIVRSSNGNIERIVEHKDASHAEREIGEINTGLLAAPARRLRGWLDRLGNDNAQGEYYLTDVIAMAVADGVPVRGTAAAEYAEVHGINNRRQLADAEAILRDRHAAALLDQGVTLVDPRRIDVRGRLSCGSDVVIDVNVVLEGNVELGDNVYIGPGSVIRNARIGTGSRVEALCHIEGALVGEQAQIGPYARLRPGSELAHGAKAGNFVEIKKSRLGAGAKVNHLTYIGDADVGADVNVGAGTITCNYDGVKKHRTVIEDGAFIGSNTSLVAPVTVAREATIGAGSVITKNAPAGKLTLTRARQITLDGWQRPSKKEDK